MQCRSNATGLSPRAASTQTGPCGPSFRWRAPTASGATTARPRTSGRRQVGWSSRNTAGGVARTRCIGSRSRYRGCPGGHRARAWYRPVAQLAEHRSPKPGVGGSIPSWPASYAGVTAAFAAAGRDQTSRTVFVMELTPKARTPRLEGAEWGSRGPRGGTKARDNARLARSSAGRWAPASDEPGCGAEPHKQGSGRRPV